MSISITFDLCRAGGRVIDPASGIDVLKDVPIVGGKIAAIEYVDNETRPFASAAKFSLAQAVSLMMAGARSEPGASEARPLYPA